MKNEGTNFEVIIELKNRYTTNCLCSLQSETSLLMSKHFRNFSQDFNCIKYMRMGSTIYLCRHRLILDSIDVALILLIILNFADSPDVSHTLSSLYNINWIHLESFRRSDCIFPRNAPYMRM